MSNAITEISNNLFYGCTSLQYLFIRSLLTSIGEKALYNCTAFRAIYYKGSKDQWDTVTKGTDWNKKAGSNNGTTQKTYSMQYNVSG
jgi:hypothetical protein